MARNKTKKRQQGLELAGRLRQAGDRFPVGGEKPKPGRPPRKLRKLSDEQVINRFQNAREKTKGKPGKLKKLKAQISGPETRNLVPGPNGMEGPNAEARRQLQKLRQGLSGRRGLRQEARRREIGPYNPGKEKRDREKKGGKTPGPERQPLNPPTMGQPTPDRQPIFGAPAAPTYGPPARMPNSRDPNAPGYIRNPRPRRRRR